MASSQEIAIIQLKGEMFNNLRETLRYDSQKPWIGSIIKHSDEVAEHSHAPFSQENAILPGSSCKGALVYEFAIQKRAPQYWVFAWHSPAVRDNKAFTKLYLNKKDINWETIEKELDNSTNVSKYAEGGVKVEVAVPSQGICTAAIEYAPPN